MHCSAGAEWLLVPHSAPAVASASDQVPIQTEK